jgi:serine/threonine-protein kinase
MPFDNGEIFAGYVIQRMLGSGGMGEVYLAQHPRLPRQDALKILSVSSGADDEFRARFVREAELAATLRHPNIVGILDRGEFNDRLWISMDYVEGADAGRLIRESYPGGMPEQDVCEIVTAVADALDFGHEHRLLHRDVKPENILVTGSDAVRRRVLLTDFGIARRIDDASNLTNTNIALGTINYVAPEQLLGRPLDGRADQYALAATAFHLLTGSPLFQDSNPAVIISHHLGTTPPRISERRPDLAHLDHVLARALAKDPTQRFPTCMDFARALAQQRPRSDAPPVHPQTQAQGPGRDQDARPLTQRLERLVVHGTAHRVTQGLIGAHGHTGIRFQMVPFDPVNGLRSIDVEIQPELGAGRLGEGDEVEVSGVWDGNTLDADEIRVFSVDVPAKRQAAMPKPRAEAKPRTRGRIAVIAAALVAVIVLAVGATVWVTDGFGAWTSSEGPIVKPASATVFSPNGSPDNPQDAGKAIDGDPDTSWSTVTYRDADPFPTFIEGQGLMLHLSEPTALSAVTIDLSSTGTEVQIRASPTEKPAALDDTTELAPTATLQPGENRIEIRDRTKTSNVLVWISKLGTTDGQSRTSISEVTLQAAG